LIKDACEPANIKYLKKNFKSQNSENLYVKFSPVAPEIPLQEVVAETEAKFSDLKEHKLRKLGEAAVEIELTFKSSKALTDFITELNKGTTPFNKYLTSAEPKVDYPHFVISLLKRSLMNQKLNKLENSGHPMQNQFRPQMGGYNKYAQQQQFAYAQMMNQMAMMGYPHQQQQPGFAPFPQPNYPFPGQNFGPGRSPNQYGKHQGFGPNNGRQGYQGKNPYGYQGAPQKNEKAPFVYNSLQDIKANRAVFDVMSLNEKTQVYKRLILQKLKTVPELIKH
jgi:hypothetical protein